MEQPKVSVIMPVYNTETYVAQAIQSVLDQDLRDIELIVVNDGSTDRSLAVIESWAVRDNRLQVITQQNRGLSGARNAGLALANGKYIYFMDSDDILLPDTFSSCYEYCESDNLDFVFFDAEVFSDEIHDAAVLNKFSYKRKRFLPYVVRAGDEAFEQLLQTFEFFSSACLIFCRRDLLLGKQLLFEEGIVHEDQLFTALVYLNANCTSYIPTRFFIRRVRPDSIMTKAYSLFNIKCYFTVGKHLLYYAEANPGHKRIVDLYLSQMLDAAVWKANVLPIKHRLWILWECLLSWNNYIQAKTYFVLLFKKYMSAR